MTKIKNFRIHLRAREIVRWLKNNRRMAATPEMQLAVESAIEKSKAFLHPAAVYTTLTRATAEKATSIAFPDHSVAASIIAVTIGPLFDSEQTAALQNDDPRAQFLDALKEEGLQQSIHFAVRLLQEQAKEEECELSSPVLAEDVALLSSLTTLLGSQRIGIQLNPAQPEWPSHARLVWTYWTPARRAASRKSDAKPVKAAA